MGTPGVSQCDLWSFPDPTLFLSPTRFPSLFPSLSSHNKGHKPKNMLIKKESFLWRSHTLV